MLTAEQKGAGWGGSGGGGVCLPSTGGDCLHAARSRLLNNNDGARVGMS